MHGTAAEWFAVGVTCHEFVSGRRPFETSKLQAFRYHSASRSSLDLSFLESCSHLSPECKDFIAGLLHPVACQRMGSKGGVSEIEQHAWLSSIDRLLLEEQSIPASYVPPTGITAGVDLRDCQVKLAIQNHLRSEVLTVEQQMKFQRFVSINEAFLSNALKSSNVQLRLSQPIVSSTY